MLLWQSSEGTGLQPIAYGGKKVPSWSWQALYGKIEFAVPAIDSMEWIRKITWDEDGDILLAEIASFRNVTVEQASLRCKIINEKGHYIEWIQYDGYYGYTDFWFAEMRCLRKGSLWYAEVLRFGG
jgi:hypothetical protein